MKRMITPFLMTLLLMPAVTAWAADTTTVTVSATVVGTCRFNSGGTLDFGTLSTGDVTTNASTQPQFWCTQNVSYTITDDDGLNEVGTTHRMTDGTNFIPYTFTYTATGTGAGASSPITMDIQGTVLESDYTAVPAGTYSDTVTLSINP